MLNVLVISYAFPPTGGAGVQRVAKFVKYLPRCGVQPTVLTVSNPSVPLQDDSLVHELPESVRVIRARSLEPGYWAKDLVASGRPSSGRRRPAVVGTMKRLLLGAAKTALQPDPQILWLPYASREGARELRSGDYDAVFVSGPPFSAFLLATRLGRRFGLPTILDFRDEWDLSNANWENKSKDRFSSFLQRRMRRSVLHSAAAILATTKRSADSIRQECREVGGRARVECIYNGYDEDDFPPAAPQAKSYPAKINIVYVGTLWNLTSIAPLRDCLERVASTRPDLLSRLEVRIVGRRVGSQADVVESMRRLPISFVVEDYAPHGEALKAMRQADVLCLLLSGISGLERVVPAKLFEYLACGRPILAIVPPGEAAELLDGVPGCVQFDPTDVGGLCEWMTTILTSGSPPPLVRGDEDLSPFRRQGQAEQLARLFREVCGNGQRSKAPVGSAQARVAEGTGADPR